ncbi:MAG: signal peptidase I [Thermoplasmata archaeon]|nr:signal peptidase I [Thermoplasmata archaeon]
MIDVPGIFALVAGIAALGMLPWLVRGWRWVWSAGIMAVLLAWLYDGVSPDAVGWWFPLAFGLFAAAPLGVYYLWVRYGERSEPARFGFWIPEDRAAGLLALSAAFVGIFLVLTLEPGFLLGFSLPPLPDPYDFGLYLLILPVLALGQEAIFRGYVLIRLADTVSFRAGLFASAILFGLTQFNPFVIQEISRSQLIAVIFGGFITSVALGLFLGFYCYKSSWSLLGTWSFRTGILWFTFLTPVVIANLAWEYSFIFALIAIVGMLIVAYAGLREPRYQARHYLEEPLNPRRGTLAAAARTRQQIYVSAALVAAVLVVLAFAAPIAAETERAPVRVLAIASGSMVPTLNRGDLVFLTRVTSPDQLQVGDIAAYNAPYLSTEGPVVHRIIAIHYNGSTPIYTFKGDHNPSPDPRPVQFYQIEGKFVGSVPLVGYLVLSPALAIALILVLALVSLYRSTSEPGRRPRPRLPLRENPI